jgi:site-specific DNA-methyltransferase (adenine-specific)
LPHTAPAKVLDITAGSGTTVQTARLLGRIGIGFDISHEYLSDLAQKRVAQSAKVYRKPEVPPVIQRRPLPENDAIIGDMAAVLPGLPRSSVDLLFIDPPFNLGKDYGGGVDDAQSEARYWEQLTLWLDLALPLLKPTGSLVLHHTPEWAFRAASYLEERGLTFRRWVAWRALSGWTTRRDDFRPEHYAFVWFSQGEGCKVRKVLTPHPRCARCGEHSTDWGGKEQFRDEAGQRMSDVWQLERAHHAEHKGRAANELPVEAVLRWVLALTDPGDYVLDPTMGSGTTAAACELTGRRWGGVELVANNLHGIRVKVALARGAREVAGDVDALAADARMALGNELARAWGVENVAPLWLDRGREAARKALDASLATSQPH